MKYKGKMVVTLELLKQMLDLDESENIIHIYRTDSDMERDSFTILIDSNKESKHTLPVAEAALIPEVTKDDKKI